MTLGCLFHIKAALHGCEMPISDADSMLLVILNGLAFLAVYCMGAPVPYKSATGSVKMAIADEHEPLLGRRPWKLSTVDMVLLVCLVCLIGLNVVLLGVEIATIYGNNAFLVDPAQNVQYPFILYKNEAQMMRHEALHVYVMDLKD